MIKTPGHFTLHDGTPCLVLTSLPAALIEALRPPVSSIASDQAAEEVLWVNSKNPANPRPGTWAVNTGDGIQEVEGVLYSLVSLGESGRREARANIERAAALSLEHSAHNITLDDSGILASWSGSPIARPSLKP